MLFKGNPTLFAIKRSFNLAHPKLYVKVGRALVEDVAVQLGFYLFIPYLFWIQVQIFAKAAGYNCSARKLMAKLGRYSQPPLVVKLTFKVDYRCHTLPHL